MTAVRNSTLALVVAAALACAPLAARAEHSNPGPWQPPAGHSEPGDAGGLVLGLGIALAAAFLLGAFDDDDDEDRNARATPPRRGPVYDRRIERPRQRRD